MQNGRWLTERGSKPHSYEDASSAEEENRRHKEEEDKSRKTRDANNVE